MKTLKLITYATTTVFCFVYKDVVPLEKTLPFLELYQSEFDKEYMSIMLNKLGLLHKEEDDQNLIKELFRTMQVSCVLDMSKSKLCKAFFKGNFSRLYKYIFDISQIETLTKWQL